MADPERMGKESRRFRETVRIANNRASEWADVIRALEAYGEAAAATIDALLEEKLRLVRRADRWAEQWSAAEARARAHAAALNDGLGRLKSRLRTADNILVALRVCRKAAELGAGDLDGRARRVLGRLIAAAGLGPVPDDRERLGTILDALEGES